MTVALAEALERWKKPARSCCTRTTRRENLYPYGPPAERPCPAAAVGRRRDLPVQGVYSHPVAPDLQRRKLYALESMHDLRLSPAEQASCGDPARARRPDYPRSPTVDYFRRGPRPEEIFFVFDRDGVRDLVARVRREGPAARRAQ